jgi:hypothetical protein
LTAPLVLKPATLGEVVVKASRPVLSYNHGNLTVDVANSYLKDDVSLESILGKLPGLIVDEGEISMFGKDRLMIYINDHKIHSPGELKSLQPLDIDKIEIIRNVGSEYDSNVDAVIKIRTRKKRDEKIFVSLNDNFNISHYLSNSADLSLYLGHNEKLSQYFTYGNNIGKGRQFDKKHTYNYFDDYRNLNFKDEHLIFDRKGNNLFYSLNYSPDKDKEFGVQYSGSFPESRLNASDIQSIYHDENLLKTLNLNREDIRSAYLHNIGFNYKQQINNTGELSIIADYVIQNSHVTNELNELTNEYTNKTLNVSDAESKVISINPQYKITGNKIKYNFGIKSSYIVNNSVMEHRRLMKTEHNQSSEYLGGAYMTLDADLSFVNIRSGLRMEYTSSDIRSDNGSNDLTGNSFDLFPNISINRNINKHFDFTAYYRRQISRPALSHLNSTSFYQDSLTYTSGNPYLKPAVTDMFNFNVNIYNVDFSIAYNIYKNSMSLEYLRDSLNPNVLTQRIGNVKEKYGRLILGLSYTFKHPVFNNTVSLNFSKSDMKMLFNKEILRLNKPRYYFQTSGNIKILKNTNFDYSFSYNSSGDSGRMRYTDPYSNLSATITQHLMNRKWMIALSVQDIFDKNKGNRWISFSNDISTTMYTTRPDTRYVSLSVRYNLGKNKSIRKKTSDTDHINRL